MNVCLGLLAAAAAELLTAVSFSLQTILRLGGGAQSEKKTHTHPPVQSRCDWSLGRGEQVEEVGD